MNVGTKALPCATCVLVLATAGGGAGLESPGGHGGERHKSNQSRLGRVKERPGLLTAAREAVSVLGLEA